VEGAAGLDRIHGITSAMARVGRLNADGALAAVLVEATGAAARRLPLDVHADVRRATAPVGMRAGLSDGRASLAREFALVARIAGPRGRGIRTTANTPVAQTDGVAGTVLVGLASLHADAVGRPVAAVAAGRITALVIGVATLADGALGEALDAAAIDAPVTRLAVLVELAALRATAFLAGRSLGAIRLRLAGLSRAERVLANLVALAIGRRIAGAGRGVEVAGAGLVVPVGIASGGATLIVGQHRRPADRRVTEADPVAELVDGDRLEIRAASVGPEAEARPVENDVGSADLAGADVGNGHRDRDVGVAPCPRPLALDERNHVLLGVAVLLHVGKPPILRREIRAARLAPLVGRAMDDLLDLVHGEVRVALVPAVVGRGQHLPGRGPARLAAGSGEGDEGGGGKRRRERDHDGPQRNDSAHHPSILRSAARAPGPRRFDFLSVSARRERDGERHGGQRDAIPGGGAASGLLARAAADPLGIGLTGPGDAALARSAGDAEAGRVRPARSSRRIADRARRAISAGGAALPRLADFALVADLPVAVDQAATVHADGALRAEGRATAGQRVLGVAGPHSGVRVLHASAVRAIRVGKAGAGAERAPGREHTGIGARPAG